jgi:hypothetical protein
LDALGEMVILEHVGRLQVFVINCVVLTNQLERCLVMEVLPLALHFLMRLGEQCHRLAPTCAAFLAARNTPLRGLQRAFGFALPTGGEDARTV